MNFTFETYKKNLDSPKLFLAENIISFIHGHLLSPINIKSILYITNYRLIFQIPLERNFERRIKLIPDFFQIPVTLIRSMEKENSNEGVIIDFSSKDCRKIKFRLAEEVSFETKKLLLILEKCIFIENSQNFAYEAYKQYYFLELKYKGWKIYDISREFERQKVEIKPILEEERKNNKLYLFRYLDNSNGKFCNTYPSLVVIPNNVSFSTLQGSVQFRSKNRFPIMTYYYKDENVESALWRSSQINKGLMSKRSKEDELYLRLIGNPTLYENISEDSKTINLYIFDLRPYINAVGNQIKGKGYENTADYKNAVLEFQNIENCHFVRDSFKKIEILYTQNIDEPSHLLLLHSSSWLLLLSHLLLSSYSLSLLLQKGLTCLVHCSDGWDRTPQITSITQILIDPFYRTIEGFAILIEKDWRTMGHQFWIRGGGRKYAPIFVQFLDAVGQVAGQFPSCFEFDERLLRELSHHVYSSFFGTFLSFNSYYDDDKNNNLDKTISCWSYVLANKNYFKNPLFDRNCKHALRPSWKIKDLKVWEEFFGRWREKAGCADEKYLEVSEREALINRIKELEEKMKQFDDCQEKK